MTWLLYGAGGYTGRLVARLAVARGQRPVLAGRSAHKVAPLAAELGLGYRVFGLDDPAALRRGLEGVESVAHCAGPFSATALPMVEACLDTGRHYLDITGEIDVLEQVHGLGERAREAKVVLLPGAGFDVVPSDCLAASVAAALPSATHLDLAFVVGGGASRGTALSMIEGLEKGAALARVDGVIRQVPLGWRRVTASFRTGRAAVAAVGWGDVSTAYYSTGIPNITTYTRVPPGGALAERLIRLAPVRRLARAGVGRFLRGPDEKALANTRAQLWARARDARGRTAEAALSTQNAYALTADAVVRIAARLPELPPGAQTPSLALGADFVTELDGVVRNGPVFT